MKSKLGGLSLESLSSLVSAWSHSGWPRPYVRLGWKGLSGANTVLFGLFFTDKDAE